MQDGKCVSAFEECGAESKACKVFGLCQLRAGVCVTGSDADCAASKMCDEVGSCRLAPLGMCH